MTTAVTFSPEGDQFALALPRSGDDAVKVWDSTTGKPLWQSSDSCRALFYREGRLIGLMDSQTLTTRDLQAGHDLGPLRSSPGSSYLAADRYTISRDGSLCAESADSGDVFVWGLARKELQSTIKRNTPVNRVSADDRRRIVFSGDSTLLAARDGEYLKVWETRDGQERARLRAWPFLFAFTIDGKLLLVESGGRVSIWRPGEADRKPLVTLEGVNWESFDVSLWITSDNRRLVYLAVQETTSSLHVWDLASGALIRQTTVPLGYDLQRSLVIPSPDGSKLAYISTHETPCVWNVDTREEIVRLPGATNYLPDKFFALTCDGACCAILQPEYRGHVLKVFDLKSRRETWSVQTKAAASPVVAIAPGGNLVAVGGNREVTLYDPAGKKQVAVLQGHTGAVAAVAFNASGKLLVSASTADGTIQLWNVANREILAVLPLQQKTLANLAFSPSGRWLATADDEHQVRLWDLAGARQELVSANLDWPAPAYVQPTAPLPGSRDALLEEAAFYHLRSRWKEAVAAYDKAIALDPAQGRAYRDRAEARLPLEQFDEALADFRKAKNLDRDLPLDDFVSRIGNAAFGSGLLRAAQGKPAEALADYARATELGIDDPNLWLSQARAHGQLGQWQQALQWAAKVVQKVPTRADAWELQGECHGKLAQWDEAIVDFTKQAKLQPQLWLPLRHRAEAQAERGRWDEAAADYARAVELGLPQDVLWYSQSLLRLAKGDTGGFRKACAEARLRAGARPDPTSAALVCWACALLPDTVTDPAALAVWLRKSQTSGPASPASQRALGAVLYRAGQAREALAPLTAANAALPDDPSTWMFLALCLQQLDEKDQAKGWLDRAVPPSLAWEQRLETQLLRKEAAGSAKKR